MLKFKSRKKKDANNFDNSLYVFDEVEEKFNEYDSLSEISFDECFKFIYKTVNDMKDTLIIASFLRQIEVPIEKIKTAYSLSDEYVEKVISKFVPELRVKAYERIEEIPKEDNVFFPGFISNLEPLYTELIDRIDFLFEIRRNRNAIIKEFGNKYEGVLNNISFLVLLNYFSVKDAFVIALNLDIIDVDEEKMSEMYSFSEDYFNRLFSSSNIDYIKNLLVERVEKFKNIDLETSFFEYDRLIFEYQDLLDRICDTEKYLSYNKINR